MAPLLTWFNREVLKLDLLSDAWFRPFTKRRKTPASWKLAYVAAVTGNPVPALALLAAPPLGDAIDAAIVGHKARVDAGKEALRSEGRAQQKAVDIARFRAAAAPVVASRRAKLAILKAALAYAATDGPLSDGMRYSVRIWVFGHGPTDDTEQVPLEQARVNPPSLGDVLGDDVLADRSDLRAEAVQVFDLIDELFEAPSDARGAFRRAWTDRWSA